MSKSQAKNFLNKVKKDKNLFNLLKSMPDSEAQYALANQMGFEFTREELHLAMQFALQDGRRG